MRNGYIGKVTSATRILRAAGRAGSAVESGRRPDKRDLDVLGISATALNRVG
jgi:hypothetical protein